jgi:phage terminase large subunit GpA-like protein
VVIDRCFVFNKLAYNISAALVPPCHLSNDTDHGTGAALFKPQTGEGGMMKFHSNCPHCGKEVQVSIYCESDGSETQPQELKQFDGYVYLLYSPTNNTYKIGRAKQVDGRYGSIAKQSPVEIRLIHQFKSENASKAEKSLHHLYSHKRVLGEWFSLSENEVEAIVAIGDYQL